MDNPKVLYISNYKNSSTGWGRFAINQILSLDRAGINVVPRPLNLTGNNFDIPERVKELEAKSDDSPDVIIQNTLPHLYQYSQIPNKKIVNIGYSLFETANNFKTSGWVNRINLMDQLWVSSEQNKEVARNTGVKVPINVVNMGFDFDYLRSNFETFPIFKNEKHLRDSYKFLWVGELTARKNLQSCMIAFHSEFDVSENVELVVKTTDKGGNFREDMNTFLTNVKLGMKLYNDTSTYKKENIFCDYVSDHDFHRLINSCDCFVSTSKAEGFCIPAAVSILLGKQTILPKHTGFLEYSTEHNSYEVDCYKTPYFGITESYMDLYSSREYCYETDIISLKKQMRKAYEERNQIINKRERLEELSYLSMEKVGEKMRGILEQCF